MKLLLKLKIFTFFSLLFFLNAQSQFAIQKTMDMTAFEKIKNFVLEKGDTKTYRSFDSNNPHFVMDDYDVYLGSDIGQRNMDNDPKKSDFNELVVQSKTNKAAKLTFIAVQKGDLLSNKNWISKSMKEGYIYVQTGKKTNKKVRENETQQFLYTFIEQIEKSKVECGDLWNIYDEKPIEVEFLECKRGQGQEVVAATYKVKGQDIAVVEKLLVEKYGMGKLRFVCCGYEPENGKRGGIRSKKMENINPDFFIEITLSSNDDFITKEGKRKEAHEFDFMLVTIRVVYV
jgi:hypothetical protein